MAGLLDDIDCARAKEMHLDLKATLPPGDRRLRHRHVGPGRPGEGHPGQGGGMAPDQLANVSPVPLAPASNYGVLPVRVAGLRSLVDVVVSELTRPATSPTVTWRVLGVHLRPGLRPGVQCVARGPHLVDSAAPWACCSSSALGLRAGLSLVAHYGGGRLQRRPTRCPSRRGRGYHRGPKLGQPWPLFRRPRAPGAGPGSRRPTVDLVTGGLGHHETDYCLSRNGALIASVTLTSCNRRAA